MPDKLTEVQGYNVLQHPRVKLIGGSSRLVNKHQKVKQKGFSQISAKLHISESEIATLHKDYNADWVDNFPYRLNETLWNLGLNTEHEVILQEVTYHQNRLGQRVVCGRYYGDERIDEEWLKSGHASQEAKDKALNSKLLDDYYRIRYATEDAQAYLERRDMYDKLTEKE